MKIKKGLYRKGIESVFSGLYSLAVIKQTCNPEFTGFML